MRLKLCSVIALAVCATTGSVVLGDGPAILPPPAPNNDAAMEANSTPRHPPDAAPAAVPEKAILPVAPESAKDASATSELLPGIDASKVIPGDSASDQDADWYQPTYWFGPSPWDTGIELGINGSGGNQDSFSLRTGGYIKRESRFSKLDLTTDYNRTTANGDDTQNNGQMDVRNDWLLDEHSPWTLFATANLFYDEFQAFDLQTSADTGVGYRFIHQPIQELIGRVGGGTSREIGGPDDRWVPESLFGVEYSQKFANKQKVYSKVDYYPEWEEVGEFRLVADIGWEVELVQPSNMSLKISATDRYDSTPNGAEPNLINYSVLMLLKL